MRQIEVEEQQRQEQLLQQQRKIKKFSEIIEKKASSRSYNLDFYIGQGDDSGLGGTPEPEDIFDTPSPFLRSDASASETESVDSDVSKSEKDVHSCKLCIKPGDNKGFGFTVMGGKDRGIAPYIENVIKGGAADVTGLKDGDKIISLNGELAEDCSHASLIFSIKQALYTGVLDVRICRSDKNGAVCGEASPKQTGKGSSFADKLALFRNDETSVTKAESKATVPTRPEEHKGDSLVLRRRSAFENSKTENSASVNRRLSQGFTNGKTAVEKRRSFDLTDSPSILQEKNNINIKKGPPPVPQKPKLKLTRSSNDVYKPNNSAQNTFDNAHVQQNNLPNDTITPKFPLSPTLNMERQILEEHSSLISQENNHEEKKVPWDLKIKIVTHTNDNSVVCQTVEGIQHLEKSNISTLCDENLVKEGTNETLSETDTFGQNTFSVDPINSVHKVLVSSVEKLKSDQGENSSIVLKSPTRNFIPKTSDVELLENHSSLLENESSTVCAIHDQYTMNSTSFKRETLDSVKLDMGFALQMNVCCKEPKNINCESMEQMNNLYDCPDCVEENSSPSHYYSEKSESKSIISDTYFDNADGNLFTDASNSSAPLCLPLEKNEDDDVISTSTTTSSESPDTETVIETLPTNFSPLPNDEDTLNPLKYYELEPTLAAEPNLITEYASENSSTSFSNNNQEKFVSDDYLVPAESTLIPSSHQDSLYDTYQYTEMEDNIELEEKCNKLTSLNIIDEIEQQLMNQLAQDDSYEGTIHDLNLGLEQSIGQHFLEESIFDDDLTPRSVEPPREPPPPPPAPEDEDEENQVLPLTRINSTRRIKTELWRRRSDFLGLNTSEGIDNGIVPPPPPPRLEDMLRQEKEQTQLLERRISSDRLRNLCSEETYGLGSSDSLQCDYNSEYYFENKDDNAVVHNLTQFELWQKDMEEQNGFDSSVEFEYMKDADSSSTVGAEDGCKNNGSPLNKAKQNIHSLGAAPKAKIMESNTWITEQIAPLTRNSMDFVPRPGREADRVHPLYNIETFTNRRQSLPRSSSPDKDNGRAHSLYNTELLTTRRQSMPPTYSNAQPDVTVRTWGDRERQRPKSALLKSNLLQDSHLQSEKQCGNLEINGELKDSNILNADVQMCSGCGNSLCEGSAMGIEALQLYFHIECFRCCLCHFQLGNGSRGTDVQVKNNQLYCPNCFPIF